MSLTYADLGESSVFDLLQAVRQNSRDRTRRRVFAMLAFDQICEINAKH